MGIISQDRFCQIMAAQPVSVRGQRAEPGSLRQQIEGVLGIEGGQHPWQLRADRESALVVYEQLKQYVMQNGYFRAKVLRPWELDDQLYAGLNRAEPWWGFEFETGYVNTQSRAAAVEHVWDNFNGTCFDAEGEGDAAVEITFGPEEVSKFEDGTAQAARFMNWLDANPGRVYHGGGTNVGTHINVSHPMLTLNNRAAVCNAMNRSVGAIPRTNEGVGSLRQLMFGRATLYGGFYSQGVGENVWLEGKLFRTAYTRPVFDRYIKVCKALTTALGFIAEQIADPANAWAGEVKAYPYVSNLYEMSFEGAAPALAWSKVNADGRQMINGDYAGGTYNDTCPQSEEAVREELIALREAARIKKEIAARQKELDNRYAAEQALRKAAHDRGEAPADMPAGYIWCEDCEDFHDDDSGESIYFINDADRLPAAAAAR